MREAAEHEAVAVIPAQLVLGDCKLELGKATQQRGESELALHPGQAGTETEMDTVPERKVAPTPPDVKPIRIDEPSGVPVRGRQRDQDLGALKNRYAGDLYGLGCVPKRRVRHRRVVPEEFLDRSRDAAGVALQCGELFRVAQESDGAVTDEAGRRVVPSDDELEDRREELLFGEAIIPITR